MSARTEKSQTFELQNTAELDAGLKPESFYRVRMSPLRFRARHALLSLVSRETPNLGTLQHKFRNRWLDLYFMYSANLGAHMFYVLMCPLPGWFGYTGVLRDSVTVLGLGIFVSGWVKDYLCLPRPRSPPLVRLTHSHYTAQEYGCPSSHTTNATSMCLLGLRLVWINWNEHSATFDYVITALVLLYFFTMVFGRLYCGMHGFVDLCTGAIIGGGVLVLRLSAVGDFWDNLVFHNSSVLVPIGLSLLCYILIVVHPVPLDNCPCYRDGVSFMGVLAGLDTGHWVLSNYFTEATLQGFQPPDVPYSYTELGPVKSVLRVLLGMALVVAWKTVSKPLLLRLLRADDTNERKMGYARKPRRDIEIVVRMIVYAGIPFTVVMCKFYFAWAGLGV